MTTAHSSTTFHRPLIRGADAKRAILRLRWSVAALALGCDEAGAMLVELELQDGARPSLTIGERKNGDLADDWLTTWNGRVCVSRSRVSGMLIVDASPLAVAIFPADDNSRPVHVSCELPSILGLSGGRYEFAGGSIKT